MLTAKISDKFNVGFNGTVNSTQFWDGAKNMDGQSWWGSALYLNVDPKAMVWLTLRGEYFNDDNQLKNVFILRQKAEAFLQQHCLQISKPDGFIFIPEFRIDNASKAVFIDKDGAAKKSSSSFLVAAIYSF